MIWCYFLTTGITSLASRRCTVVLEVDMSLAKGVSGDGVIKKNVLGPLGSGHRVCPGDQGVPELQERVRAIESLSAQITQLLVGMSGSLGGIHSQG